MLENHSYSQVIGRSPAPFLNEPARSGALFINSRAITHPSQPTCRHVPWTNVINAPPSLSKPFEDLYHLRPLGHAAHVTPITNVWEMR